MGRVVTYVEQRWGSGDRHGGVHLYTNGTPCKRVFVARIPELPFIPDLINHLKNVHVSTTPTMKQLMEPYRVMKEKHGVYVKGGSGLGSAHARTTETETIPTIRGPLHSSGARRRLQPKRTQPHHIPSEDKVRSRMRSINVLKIRLEAGIVPREGASREIHVRFRKRGVDHQLGVYGQCTGRWGEAVPEREERLEGVITTDMVWDGVGDRDILETAGRDLEIVCRITPRPKTLITGI